uniref:Cytochrome b561 domain-containing protein n=1 Tax=Odontella aurita TaxID=265563 RepID=A0A7S4MKV1_9STRA|mmetsp:Transcript_24521/g.71774  ORF Transcript_24521/g.71774 Transcript_24521/m.71774 type:complete len:337 (+) Transcript_24521:196-1206(+)
MLYNDVRLFTAAVVGLFSLSPGDALVTPDLTAVASLSRHHYCPPSWFRTTTAPPPKCSGLAGRLDSFNTPVRCSRLKWTLKAASDDEESTTPAPSPPVPKKPKAIGTINVATVVGSCTALGIIHRVATSGAPRLFKQHVIGAAAGTLMFLPASIGAVRSRIESVKAMKGLPTASAEDRRGSLLTHIYTHLYLTYATAVFMAVSLISIFRHKANMGKVHFASVHSRVGATSVALLAASYVVAQMKVWAPMLKRREFKFDPNLLWASRWHKRLGTAASALALGAVATGVGMSAWGREAFGPWTTGLILAGVTAVETFILLPSMQERRKRWAKKRTQKR